MMNAARGAPALFLDRDGVINEDRGYVHRIEDVAFVPGIFDLVHRVVHELGWRVVVATNQSGIGRGYFDEAAYRTLTDWICERFRADNAALAAIYHCPYHPEHGIGAYRLDHDWRKPKPGMMLQAAADLNLDLARSAAIGDKISDMQAAHAAGIGLCILLDRSARGAPAAGLAHHVIRSLPEAVPVLTAFGRQT